MAKLDENGHEILDATPIAIPLGMKRPESIQEMVARLVRQERFRAALGKDDYESFEEADDFDVDDDYDPTTPFEQHFDPLIGREISAAEVHAHPEQYKKKVLDYAEESPELEKKAEKVHKRLLDKVKKKSATPPAPPAEKPPTD